MEKAQEKLGEGKRAPHEGKSASSVLVEQPKKEALPKVEEVKKEEESKKNPLFPGTQIPQVHVPGNAQPLPGQKPGSSIAVTSVHPQGKPVDGAPGKSPPAKR